jgi:hypothetical protein
MKTKTIHHFEDEPHEVRWIASTLLNRFWLHHPEWIVDEGQYEEIEEPKSSSFRLKVSGQDIRIRHRIYDTVEEFDQFESEVTDDDIVLLDLSIGGGVTPGIGFYDRAIAQLPADRVYILTAIPHVAATRGIPSDHIFKKPPDPTRLVNIIIELLRILE